MKTKEELEQLKNEYESLNKKLSELSQDELKQVTGGGNYEPQENPGGGTSSRNHIIPIEIE